MNDPIDERLSAALRAGGFDETDAANAVEAISSMVAEYGTQESCAGYEAGDAAARAHIARKLGLV